MSWEQQRERQNVATEAKLRSKGRVEGARKLFRDSAVMLSVILVVLLAASRLASGFTVTGGSASGASDNVTPSRPARIWRWFKGLACGNMGNTAFFLIFLIVVSGVAVFYFVGPPADAFGLKPAVPKSKATTECQKREARNKTIGSGRPLTVVSASGAAGVLNIYISRSGNQVVGKTAALLIANGGSLCPGDVLHMRTTEFVSSGGPALPERQVLSWAWVNNDGTHVTVMVLIAPHFQGASDSGAYSGSVSLDSRLAQGANVAVRVHIEYQKIYLALAFGFLAAFGGFTWAWLLHNATGGKATRGYFFRHFTLCIAILLAAAIPIVNVQVLTKPDWQGSITQYISLGTVIGAAAVAATPTLRALALPRRLGNKKAGSSKSQQTGAT
jgi:hypothetical protein